MAALQEQLAELGAGKRARRRAIKAARRGTPAGVPGPVSRRSAFSLWLSPLLLLAPAMKSAQRLANAVKRHVAT
jgi:hypothetical protein